ncbi:MAG: sensor histidine kinase [Syntrophobacteria bacterium]|jgi:two-component system nitrogen regulation sensor histidine kinase NtrY
MAFPQKTDRTREQSRRRRERIIIIVSLGLIVFLTYLESHFLQFGSKLPMGSNVIIFALMNINVILLLLLVYLVTRNVVKLIFERKRKIFGHRLRTKLVITFFTLSLFPTIILFGLASQFISTSMEYWYNIQVEQSLKTSLELGKSFYQKAINSGFTVSNQLSETVSKGGLLDKVKRQQLLKLIREARHEHLLHNIAIYSNNLEPLAWDSQTEPSPIVLDQPMRNVIQQVATNRQSLHHITPSAAGDLIWTLTPVYTPTDSKQIAGLLIVGQLLPKDLMTSMAEITRGFENYQQMKMLKKPIKISHLIMLSIVTLLILFCASWFGFYLAKSITVPIQELAEGTRRIADGDLDVHVDQDSDDEIGTLVNSFNRMTLDLQASQTALKETNLELKLTSEENERRRRYMEIVLGNVAAGVVSVDGEGLIRTINKSAESMFGLEAEDVLHRHYSEVLQTNHMEIAGKFTEMHQITKQPTMQRQVRSLVGNRLMTLLVTVSILHDEEGQYMGIVVVFDDLTELEKAQRMAAWREVARRIAHEIKNPLTPIQLSAQRLRRKYLQRFAGDGKVFEECTRTIINQVDELKLLVNEFSNFARMPAASLAPNDLPEIVEETISLFRESHPSTTFAFEQQNPLPLLDLDRDQMKRVMINLLDNAVAAVDGNGEISVNLSFDEILKIARLEVSDNGPGIPAKDKIGMFEPYFSTKEKGSGLGLAIVSNIIADHHGFIRVRDNQPRGTIIVIELPGGSRKSSESMTEIF